ncbi:FecCD family ABC transporter permease [Actinorugispora endophytica]|uniref:Iron complex transport system permease protein n=1 Tax=Actinorugispora endophytica TaxID=1605990 RepID=A0A4V3D8X9_9ACTN|nr:iron ABC transporter permease [Actinorugispora endophytica]TDQ53680.1 iron complex transport system permease protein [Actinorugispora endophytica]
MGANRGVRAAGLLWTGGGLVLLAAAMVLGAGAGAASITSTDIVHELLARLGVAGVDPPLSERQRAVLLQLRLPRVVLGAVVGGLLAVAGASYQGVFRNPLADPYLLGAAGGAGLGATLLIVYGGGLASPLPLVPMAAFAGALAGVMGAYLLGRTAGGGGTASLLLAGVAVSSFLAAVQTLVQQAEIDDLQRVYSWLLGGLGRGGWEDLRLVAPYAVVSTLVLLVCAYLLDLLALGDDKAVSLGLNPAAVRLVVISAASLATAAAVAVSGLIGFVGIVVPHVVRRLVGPAYRRILPVSLLFGGAFLVAVDILARTLVAPAELPIGVVTAFIGAPFFVLVLRATRGRVA